ncbi:DUF4232 domain-containing protein [Streptomyces endophyticus]|uniref:DUF4232 domain-containing protein n=1 Tax=Streptomyces endophyticus TaxID=714166 RepID=A0ABU6FDU9_9ACTN|nr:DUF4232 domain-containing protein [Streptomyces endophyticus]MEB8342220.1 DUF4232 domain-containing protein [Streptomyces endophyticus]
MRARHVTRHAAAAVAAALALTALTVPASGAAGSAAPAALARCGENDVTVRADPSDDNADILKLSVRNDSSKACLVDRVPTVTYGELDGAALPLPTVPHAGRTLAAHHTAYAAVLSVSNPEDAKDEAPAVMYVTVAAVPDHQGRSFQALTLGSPTGVRVWEPVTTLWQSSSSQARQVLMEETTGRGTLAV